MRVASQPLIRWLRVQRPATAFSALIARPQLRLRHGSTARKTQHGRGGVVHRQPYRACISTSSSLTEQSPEPARVLKLARQATLQTLPPQSVVKVQGHGKQMGMQVAWQLVIGHDGACMQHVHGKELSFRWGTEGVSNPNAWEALLITEWVKSGMWLSPSLTDVLDIQCLSDQEEELEGTEMPEQPRVDRHGNSRTETKYEADDSGSNVQRSRASLYEPEDGPSTSESSAAATVTAVPSVSQAAPGPAGAARKQSSKAATSGVAEQQQTVQQDTAMHIDWEKDSSNSSGSKSSRKGSSNNRESWSSTSNDTTGSVREDQAPQQKPYVMMAVKLRSGKIVHQVRLCTETWQPLAVLQPICGEVVTWHYLDWQEWVPDFHFPQEHHQLTPSGGNNSFITTSVKLESAPQLSTFVMPQPPLTPSDTHYDPDALPLVQAWHTRSGHVLVQPSINGRTLGYMMLDTGASGLVIEEAIANELGLSAFGEMYVTGMAGSLRCQFRRAKQLQLGPVTIDRPLFMQMSLSGVVTGAPGPVIGILGYDLYRRCVMQLPPSSHDANNTPFQLSMFDPSTFQYPSELNHRWQSMSMVANLPHVEVQLTVKPDSTPFKCLLMLDSGAGGVDAMFHKRAVNELGLVQSTKHGTRTLTGVGGSNMAGMRVKSAEMHSMDLSDHQFNAVRCLFTESDGLDHTLYSSGILCGDIMNRCTVVLDYARNRIMFVPKSQ